jgi:hypothetical protein
MPPLRKWQPPMSQAGVAKTLQWDAKSILKARERLSKLTLEVMMTINDRFITDSVFGLCHYLVLEKRLANKLYITKKATEGDSEDKWKNIMKDILEGIKG